MAALFSFSRFWSRVMYVLHHGNASLLRADQAARRFVPMAVLLDETQAYKPESFGADRPSVVPMRSCAQQAS